MAFALISSVYLSYEAGVNYEDNRVVTNLHRWLFLKVNFSFYPCIKCIIVSFYRVSQLRTTLPVTELDFPSVTVCRQGLNMAAVKRALALDYQAWLSQPNSARRRKKRSAETSLQEFMKEK